MYLDFWPSCFQSNAAVQTVSADLCRDGIVWMAQNTQNTECYLAIGYTFSVHSPSSLFISFLLFAIFLT